jgi:hypothetical protein
MKEQIDNIEGDPPTEEERAAMARELDKVAPTPAEKFRLMFGQRPTLRMDSAYGDCGQQLGNNWRASRCYLEGCKLERELDEAREERDRLAEACRWAQRELGKHNRPSPIDKALAELKGGTDE